MHKLIKGVQGVEVIVDGFVVVLFGHTHLKAVPDPCYSIYQVVVVGWD